MNCREFEAHVHPYVDGELAVGETAAAEAHLVECAACTRLVRRERDFRELLRRQPREPVPPEFRARILGSLRAQRQRAMFKAWFALPAGAAAAAAVVVAVFLPAHRGAAPLVGDLVDKHLAYAQVEHPAEFVSSDPADVREWFHQRAGLRVAVPDFSPAGIRLVGARLAEAREHKAAYLLYEKGITLLSVFVVPRGGAEARLSGARVSYRGHDYVTSEWKGQRTVAWAENSTLFGLVSMLHYDALLECADRLRTERASQSQL